MCCMTSFYFLNLFSDSQLQKKSSNWKILKQHVQLYAAKMQLIVYEMGYLTVWVGISRKHTANSVCIVSDDLIW